MRSASSAVRSCRVAALLLLAAIALPGVSGGSDSAPVPTVAPTITSTTPANGTTNVSLGSLIEVRFSEPVNASTLLVGFAPVTPNSTFWPSNDTLQIVPDPPGLSNCTMYTVQVRVDDLDEGLPLVRGSVPDPWTFLTACDRPWVVSTVPVDGDGNVRTDADLTVTFSEPMNCITLQVLFSPALPPPGTTLGSCDASRTVLTLQLTGGTRFQAGTTYAATASGEDDAGNPLIPSPTPNPWSFTVNAPPTVGKPSLSVTGCLDGGTTVAVTWTMGDDLEAVTALTVRLLYLNGSVWQTFAGPSQGFPSPETYMWTLPSFDLQTRVRVQANDSAGGLGTNTSDSFRIDNGPPRILGTNPVDGARDVPIDATLSIIFSEPMNRTSVEGAISSVPPLAGAQFTWAPGNATIFIDPGGLPDRTFFRVTVAGTAQDTCGPGRPMGADVSFTFTSGKAPAAPPARVWVVTYDEASITVAWEPVTTFVTGRPIPPTSAIEYRVFRGNGTDLGEMIANTTTTQITDRNLAPLTNYTYRIIAIVDGVASFPTAPLSQETRAPFLVTPEGRLSVLVSLAAVSVALVIGGEMRRRRKKAEGEAQLTREIQGIVAQVRKVRMEPDPEIRRLEEEALQAHFRALVEGEDPDEARPHPRLEGLYRALAEALVHSPEVDVARGRQSVDAELGRLAANLRQHGAAYRLLSEAEASVQSGLFPGLPESARKALLLVYFYALEEYLGNRLRGLVPAGSTILLGERGHINVRRRGWQAQWAGLTLGNLLYMMDHNRHFFIADEKRWEAEVEPALRAAVEARNRTAHPSREGPPLERVRALVFGALPAVESILRWPGSEPIRPEPLRPEPRRISIQNAGGERIVRVVYSVRGQIGRAGMPRLFDLILTDRRLVGVMKKNLTGAVAAGAAFGAIGGALAGKSIADASKSKPPYDVGQLDRLATAEKTSFSLPWGSVERGKIGGLITKTLELKAGDKVYYFLLTKEMLEEIKGDLVERFPALLT